jgi:hypothetical protein
MPELPGPLLALLHCLQHGVADPQSALKCSATCRPRTAFSKATSHPGQRACADGDGGGVTGAGLCTGAAVGRCGAAESL